MRMFTRFPLLAALVAAAALAAFVPFGRSVIADDETVSWALPATSSVTISPGDTVTWQWGDALPHTVTSTGGPASFDSGQLTGSGETFARTFTEAGTYTYQCNVHPANMTGTVVVEAAQAPTATPPAATNTPAPTTAAPTATSPATTSTPGAMPTATRVSGTPVPPATGTGTTGGGDAAWLLFAGIAVAVGGGATLVSARRTR